MDDLVEIKIKLSRKQRDWLQGLGSDLRASEERAISEAIWCCVNPCIEAHEKDPYNIARYKVREEFRHYMMSCRAESLPEARKLIAELELMVELAGRESEAKDIRRALESMKSGRP